MANNSRRFTTCACGFKGESVNFKDQLEEHKRNMKKWCTLCNKGFRGNYELREHTKVAHGDHSFNCSECDKKFKSKNGVKYHQRRAHTKKINVKTHCCEECDIQFLTKQAHDDHQRLQHKSPKLKCDLCKTLFVYHASYNRHKSKCKGSKSSVRMYVCRNYKYGTCNKRYKLKKYAREHFETCHNAKKYFCKKCKREYRYRSSLSYHMKKCSK